MLGRPNLLRLHCSSFRVYFHVNLPASTAQEVFQSTYVHETDAGRQTAIYGKLYHAGGVSHIAETTIYQYQDTNYHVTLYLGLEDRGKPPRDIKPPEKLMTLLLANGPTEAGMVNVYATYSYLASDGWRSAPPLPFPFPEPLRVARGFRFTHVDGWRLSNVEDGRSVDWIDIKHTHQGEYTHEIGLRRNRAFSEGMIRSLLREGARLSSSLVHLEESSDGN